MPFKSKKQARWMYANDPKMAERWEDETPDLKHLPNRAKKKGKKKNFKKGLEGGL